MLQKIYFLLLSTLLSFFTVISLHAKEQAALSPMGTLGEFSEMEKQIVFNSLQENLSIHYALASQQSFEKAQEQAFDELEAEECTEDQCFALIQQILQVENLFIFSMTREGSFTQLSLTRVDLDSQRTVRTALCQDCNVGQLNAKISGLVQGIAGKTSVLTSAPVTLPVARGKGSVFIASQPTDAEIVLDGKILEDTSDILLKNLRAGKHRILLRKGDMEQQQEFEVKANEMVLLNFKLKLKQVLLLVSSRPFKAKVFLDGKIIGQTPLQTKTTVGSHKLTVQLKGYVPQTKNIKLSSRENTEIEVFLKALGTLVLTRLHPESQITLDGTSLRNQGAKTQSFALAPSQHTLKIQRTGFPVREQDVTLKSRKTTTFDAHLPSGNLVLKNLEIGDRITIKNRPPFTSSASEITLELPPRNHEIRIQRYGFEVQHQRLRIEDGKSKFFNATWTHTQRYLEHQAWSKKRWMITGSAALSYFYMTLENAKVQKANNEKKTLEEKVIAASSNEEAASYRSQAQSKADEGKQSAENAQNAFVLALGLAGWATWVWMEEPAKPQAVGWNWNVTSEQQVSVSYLKPW